MLRVYVAGAYSANNVMDVFSNMRRGIRAATKIFLLGDAPFCPWLDYHFVLSLEGDEKLTVEQFYEYSLKWMLASDVVVVLPDSQHSKGTQEEIRIAKQVFIPVYSYDEWLKQKESPLSIGGER